MEAHRSEATVGGDGSVTVHGVPFPAGESVEVIVLQTQDSPPNKPRRKAGSMKGRITVPDDFDDPLDEFKPYM